MDRDSGTCPVGGRGAASRQMENSFENLNNVQALRAQSGRLHREQVALLQALSRQDQAKRRAKKLAKIQRESVPVQQGERRIILMRPGRRTEPSLAKSVVHNIWKKRIIKEPMWPKELIPLLPKERKMAAAYMKRKEAEQRDMYANELRARAAMLQAEQQQLLQNIPIQEIPSELLEGARAPEVCPAPEPSHAPRVTARPPRAAAGTSARRPSTSHTTRRPLRSGTSLSKQKEREDRAKKQSLKEEEQILKKLTTKQKQVVDIEMQKLKQEEAALLRNLQIQRQQEATRARRKKEEERKRPQDKRRMPREPADTKRQKVQEQKCAKEKMQEQKLIKERAEVQRYEKDWLMVEEQELQQRQRLLDERAAEIEKMLQSETAEIQSQWQNLQQELQDEREKLRRDQEYLEEIRAEQAELDSFEEHEREMVELDAFEEHEREMEELEAFGQQDRLQEEVCEREEFPAFNPAVPVDLTLNYQPLPPVNFMPSDAGTDESTCNYPGL